MRTIAIGDVHGCYLALQALVNSLQLTSDDRLIFLGDLIDRGPNSRGVVDLIVELKQQLRVDCIRGNHEIILQGYLQGLFSLDLWKMVGGDATLASYGGSLDNLPPDHRQLFAEMHPWLEEEKHIYLHACYDPRLEMKDQSLEMLFWQHLSLPVPRPHRSGKQVLCGHTPQIDGEVADWGHLVCIDTFCFGGRWLTAMDVDTKQIWQADMLGNLRRES